ncbi:hypothetical protein BH20ACT2_BH20ACT2_06300 [soil metagenome]
MMTKAQRSIAAVAATVLLIAGGVVAVRAAYGYFADEYEISATFPRAGQSLGTGADVKYRGVNVGEVSGIELIDRQVEIRMALGPDIDVPTDARAEVKVKTLFGEKFVDLTFPRGPSPPFLEDGGVLADARAGTEVEELIAATTPLFEDIDATELATLVTELTDAVRGEGENISRAFDAGARATALFADTVDAQLRALDSTAAFFGTIEATGDDLNAIAANNNVALPTFNRARADFERLLVTLRPFADTLGDLLIEYRPEIDTILVEGDNVVRVLIAQEADVADVVFGLSRYVFKFSEGKGETLPDGSVFAYFKNFVFFSDIELALCSIIAQEDELGPLQDVLLTSGVGVDCSDYLANQGRPVEAPPDGAPIPALPVPAPVAPDQPVTDLAADVFAGVAGADRTEPGTAADFLDRILGGL